MYVKCLQGIMLSADIDLNTRYLVGSEKGHQIQHEGVWEHFPEKQ